MLTIFVLLNLQKNFFCTSSFSFFVSMQLNNFSEPPHWAHQELEWIQIHSTSVSISWSVRLMHISSVSRKLCLSIKYVYFYCNGSARAWLFCFVYSLSSPRAWRFTDACVSILGFCSTPKSTNDRPADGSIFVGRHRSHTSRVWRQWS